MITLSAVLLVIANTVAATGAVLDALKAAMFETGGVASRVLTADAADIAEADLSWQQGEVADVAWQEEPRRLQFSKGNLSFG